MTYPALEDTTVALPIISAAGIECSVVPTAVLSTHTGGIDGYTFRLNR